MLGRVLAWMVHLFTASGLLAGFMALLAAIDGDYRQCMLWLLVALVIDGIDGTLARLARVGEKLPAVSGKLIDFVVDFFNYAILPAYLFYAAIPLEGWMMGLSVAAILLSSSVYYGIEQMVSEDGHHFIGFPVLWNLVLFVYLFLIPEETSSGWFFGLTQVLAWLHFVPIHVPYPSRGGRWFWLTAFMSVVFIAAAVGVVYLHPQGPVWLTGLCWAGIGYFVLLTVVDTLAAWNTST